MTGKDGSGVAEIVTLCRSGSTLNLPKASSIGFSSEDHALVVDGDSFALPSYLDADVDGSKATFRLNDSASPSLGTPVFGEDSTLEMEFDSQTGLNYTLQGNSDLCGEWDDIREPLAGTGEPLSVSVEFGEPLDARNTYFLRLSVSDRP